MKKKRQLSCCYQASLPAAQSVVEQDVEDVTVECEEHRHAQELVPKRAAQENDNLEGNEDTLHGQEPGVDMVAGTEEELEGKYNNKIAVTLTHTIIASTVVLGV